MIPDNPSAGMKVTTIIAIVTACVGGVLILFIVLLISVLVAVVSAKRRKKNKLKTMEQAGNKGDSLKKTGTGESKKIFGFVKL